MKPYEIKLGDVAVRVDVLDPFWASESVLEEKLSELQNQLNPQGRVVGIGIEYFSSYCWLLLCVGNHCLVIKLLLLTGPYHHGGLNSLRKVLLDPDICFVGVNIDTSKMNSKWIGYVPEKRFEMTGINAYEIYDLVARIYKKPALLTCGSLQKLGSEVGLDMKPKIKFAFVEDIVFAVYDVYYSHRIADKLMHD